MEEAISKEFIDLKENIFPPQVFIPLLVQTQKITYI
jgi:hypothetical protein